MRVFRYVFWFLFLAFVGGMTFSKVSNDVFLGQLVKGILIGGIFGLLIARIFDRDKS